MADPFVAEIRMFPFTFAPKGWAWCDGQILPISQNTALYSLLGTIYGGNGKSTFALPNLQGSAPLHVGQQQPGPGLSTYALGEIGGSPSVTLLESEMPVHNHGLAAQTVDPGDVAEVTADVSSLAPSSDGALYAPTTNGNQLSPQALTVTGGSQPHNNLMSSMSVWFCIAMQGVFPARP